jgi:tetratricopeptide (TPR) repeat protein
MKENMDQASTAKFAHSSRKLLFCIGIMASVVTLSACSSAKERAEEHAAAAMAYAEAGNFTAARAALLKAVAERDDIASQWQLLGKIELQSGNLSEALSAYSHVLELDAVNVEALQYVTELSFQLGDARRAIATADQILALDPTATRALLVKGLVALDQNRLVEANQFATSILEIDPKNEFGLILKARALAKSGAYQEALKIIDDNIPAAIRTEATLGTLIEIYRMIGDGKNIVPTFDLMIARRPKDIPLKLDFAEILYKVGNPERARVVIFQLLRERPQDIELINKVGKIWIEYDQTPLSAEQIAEIAQRGSKTMRVGIARHMLALNNIKAAVAIVKPVAKAEDGVIAADARALFATALYENGKVDEAKSIADDVISIDSGNADALLLRARIALARGKLQAANNDVQIIVRDYPANEAGRLLNAEIFIKRGEAYRVRQAYEEALNDMPQSIIVARKYSDYLLGSGDNIRAAQVGRQFTAVNPSLLAGWKLLSAICKKTGDAGCMSDAAKGQIKAAGTFFIDERPGTIQSRGLFGRLR